MQITKVNVADFSLFTLIKQFLLPYEKICTSLCSYVRRKNPHIFAITKNSKIDSCDEILGVFYFNGTFLHCFPNLTQEMLYLLRIFFSDKKIKSINGEKSTTEKLISIFQQKPYQKNFYKLMILEKSASQPPQKPEENKKICRCTEDDIEHLFNLQKNYVLEEVAPNSKKVSDLEIKIALRNILKNQLVFAIFDDKIAISKANSNAIGWNFVQLGGIYTNPLYRKKYYAWTLIKILCDKIQANNKKICLFVNEKNLPAINLYKNLGFFEANSFEIAYFQ